ncbi:hypothetical protein D3C78_1376050 [compost metagenome]
MPGLQRALRTVRRTHLDAPRTVQTAPALHPFHLVLAEQELDALGQRRHAFGFLLHHLDQVELGLDLYAEVGELAAGGRFVQFGSMQQRLGRHAADIQAGAAEGFPALHAGHPEAQLAGADRRVVATGAATDHNDVVVAHAGVLCRFLKEAGGENAICTVKTRVC